MKKFRCPLLLLVVVLLLTACSSRPKDEDPQTVMDKAWERLIEKESNYQAGVVDFNGKVAFEYADSKATANGSGTLQFNNTEPSKAQFSLATILSAKGNLQGKSADIKLAGEVRALQENFFVKFDQVKLDSEDVQTNLMVGFLSNLYQGKWISLPGNPLSKTLEQDLAARTLSGKKYAEIAKKYPMLTVRKDLGNSRYEVHLDLDKLRNYLKEINASAEKPATEEELETLPETLASLPYTLELGVNDSYDVDFLKLGMEINDQERNQAFSVKFETKLNKGKSSGKLDIALTGENAGSVGVDLNAHHKEKRVKIETPKDAEPFDLGALLGGGLSGLSEEK